MILKRIRIMRIIQSTNKNELSFYLKRMRIIKTNENKKILFKFVNKIIPIIQIRF